MVERIVFVGGCPRSGTTALTRLLNRHGDILIGNERYYRTIERGDLRHEHFEGERFLRIEPGDTHDEPPGMDRGQHAHWAGVDPAGRYRRAKIVGDKYPPIFRAYGMLADRFADAHILYVLRNPISVAESYQARAGDVTDRWPFDFRRAVDDWNTSVVATTAALSRDANITILAYETMLQRATVAALFTALGVDRPQIPSTDDLTDEAAAVARKARPRDETIRQYVCLNASFEHYRALSDRAINPAREGVRRAA